MSSQRVDLSNLYIIKRSFYFYAAHRNDDLPGERCFSIHGHTYFLDCHFECKKPTDRSFSVLFSTIERLVTKVIDPFEHSLMLSRQDPWLPALQQVPTKLCLLDATPSAENVAQVLFQRIKEETGLRLVQVDLRETTTSIVSYRG